MEEVKIDSENIKRRKIKERRIIIVVFRWLIAISISLYYFLSIDEATGSLGFSIIFVIAVAYNLIITIYAFKSNDKDRLNAEFILYFDVLTISMISTQLGGLGSDIYVMFFFIIGYCGIYGDMKRTVRLGVFCILVYSIFNIYVAKSSLEEINYVRLAIKDLFIIMAIYGITILNKEVKKYGDLHKKEFKLARTDKLTGLANRHYFDQKLKEEAEYTDFTGNPLNILMFDLDNFKKFNDTYGHVWGDKMLSLFSDIIKQNIRKSDIPVRYGGEEFLILIRDLDAENAKIVAERIRRQLEKQRIYIGNDANKKRVTVSCGLSQYPKNSSNIKEAIDMADKALYHAKDIGRNVVVRYEEIGNIQQGVQIDIDSYMNH